MIDFNRYSAGTTTTPSKRVQSYAIPQTAPRLSDITELSTQRETFTPGLGEKLQGRVNQATQSVFGKQQYPTQAVLGTTGAVGGAVNDIIDAVLSPLFTNVVDTVSDSRTLQSLATSRLGSAGLDKANTAVAGATTAAQTFAERNPGTAQFAKDAFNTASIVPTSLASREGVNIARDAASISRNALTPSESALQSKLIAKFNQAVKPTAKKTETAANRFNDDIITSLKEIRQNADNLNIEDATGELVSRAPQSLQELSQALDQTKAIVFSKYDDLAKTTDGQGVTLKLSSVADELQGVAANKALNLTAPEVVKYAETWAERLRGMDNLDIQTTQEVVKLMNKNLESFYKNPTYESASKAAVDAGIANNLRRLLDETIETATGENYQQLKRTYGALKAIESDVVRAAIRDGRKNAKGLLDYTDIFTSGQIVGGILSLNPAMFTKGALERGFKEYIKYLNDPNRVIKSIFDALDRQDSVFTPKSATVGYLNEQYKDGIPVGLSIKNSVTPEKVAQTLDLQDFRTIREYLANPADKTYFPKAQELIERIGIDKADEATQERFLLDTVTEYEARQNAELE